MRSLEELKAKGYSVEGSLLRARVYQNGEFVAALSQMNSGKLGFDWHRHDQWGLRSWEVEALLRT